MECRDIMIRVRYKMIPEESYDGHLIQELEGGK